MWITKTSIQNPVFATMVMVALVVLGMFSYRELGMVQRPLRMAEVCARVRTQLSIRADSAEYAALAASNTSNNRGQANPAYVGRTDVHFLTGVPTLAPSATVGANTPDLRGLTAEQAHQATHRGGASFVNGVLRSIARRRRTGSPPGTSRPTSASD